MMIREKILNLKMILRAVLYGTGIFFVAIQPALAQTTESCTKKTTCPSGTCLLGKKANGVFKLSSTRHHSEPTCVINSTKNSCFNPIPMIYKDGSALASHLNVAAETGSRSCDVGSATCIDTKNNLRNHYGNDYGVKGLTGVKATAPADGRIKQCTLIGGGGRGIVMEFDKQCTGASCKKYTVVFMHLAAWVVKGTQSKSGARRPPDGCGGRSVKKGEVIGIVGGSNYKRKTDKLIENDYSIHLHMEVRDGTAGSFSDIGQVLSPMCDDLQSFCGGCADTSSCGKSGVQPLDSEKCYSDSTAKSEITCPDCECTETGEGDESITWYDEAGNLTNCKKACSRLVDPALVKCNYSQYLPSNDECTFCDMFKVLFNTSSVMALKSYKALASGLANLVMAVLAIWIALVVLRYISSFEAKDPRKMIQEILLQLFKVLIVWVILQGQFFNVLQLTLSPVFNTGMTFAQSITSTGSCSDSAPYMQNITGYDKEFAESSGGGLPASMGKNIVCTIKTMETAVSKMIARGRQLLCLSWTEPNLWFYVVPSVPMLLSGLMVYIAGIILLLAFPWCLVDCVLNMAIAAGLAPAAIAAWAFKATSEYLKKIWDFFMNAMFNFVFLSIIIYIIITALNQLFVPLDNLKDDVDLLMDPINGLAYWGVFGLKLSVICLLGWVFLDEGKSFAQKFARATGVSAGRGIGRSVGGFFAQAGKKAAQISAKTGKKLGGKLGKSALQAGDKLVGKRIRNTYNQFRINRTKNKGKAITDSKGNVIGYERTRRNLLTGFKKVTSRVEVNKDGKEVWSRSKQSWKNDLHNAALNWTNKRRLKKLQKSGQAIRNEKGEIIGYTRTTSPLYRLGQKVTLTAMKGKDGNYTFSKDVSSLRMRILSKISPKSSALNRFAQQNMTSTHKDLSANKAGSIKSSDQTLAIRRETDKNGNIVKEVIKFRTKEIEKHLINKDGTINMDLVQEAVSSSNFDQQTIYTALALHTMQKRGLSLSETFKNRQVSFENNALRILQQNKDGSVTEVRMAFGGHKSNQMLLDVKTTDQNGAYRRVLDNGIMNKVVLYNPTQKNASVSYQFNPYYYKTTMMQPMDQQGNFADYIDEKAAMFGFTQTDLNIHCAQVRTGKMQYVDPTIGGTQLNFGQEEVRQPSGTQSQPQPAQEQQPADTAAQPQPAQEQQPANTGAQPRSQSPVEPATELGRSDTESRSMPESMPERMPDLTNAAEREQSVRDGQEFIQLAKENFEQESVRLAEEYEDIRQEQRRLDHLQEHIEKQQRILDNAERKINLTDQDRTQITALRQSLENERQTYISAAQELGQRRQIVAEDERQHQLVANEINRLEAVQQELEVQNERIKDLERKATEAENIEHEAVQKAQEAQKVEEVAQAYREEAQEKLNNIKTKGSVAEQTLDELLGTDKQQGQENGTEQRPTETPLAPESKHEEPSHQSDVERHVSEAGERTENGASSLNQKDENDLLEMAIRDEKREIEQAEKAWRDSDEAYRQAKQQARDEAQKEAQAIAAAEKAKEEVRRAREEFAQKIEQGRKHRNEIKAKTLQGRPQASVARPDSLGGMTKKRRRRQ